MFNRIARGPNGLNPCDASRGRTACLVRVYAMVLVLAGTTTVMSGGAPSAEPVTRRAPSPERSESKPTPQLLPNLALIVPDSILLVPPAEPDCEFRTNDPKANERQKLDYGRQCYRHAEMIVRNRLHELQKAVERFTDVTSTFASASRSEEPSPRKLLEPAGASKLIDHGDRHIALGDIAVAREYYLRAIEVESADAAMKMAETYDPKELARLNVRGVKPDSAKALHWYQRALELKAPGAESRLLRLGSHGDGSSPEAFDRIGRPPQR
jgi:hypothetical protein